MNAPEVQGFLSDHLHELKNPTGEAQPRHVQHLPLHARGSVDPRIGRIEGNIMLNLVSSP